MVHHVVAIGTSPQSVKAELRRRSLPAVAVRVMERWAATRPKGSVGIQKLRRSSSDRGNSTDTPDDEIAVQDSRLWLDAPSRWRYEVDFPGGTGIFVTDGPLWWSYAPSLHAFSNESAPDRYPGGQREHQEWQLFHPDQVLAALSVTSRRVEERAGRSVEVLEAVALGNNHVPSLPSGADTYHLIVDRGREVVLRMAALADGVEFSSVEITSLQLDVPMDPSLFRIELPAGIAFSPPPSHMPRPPLLRRFFGRFLGGPRR
ncbi:MAG: hypothetical protein M3P18_09515 [Actinomycetota bacterium]|nr:hypothetical protein [Actinomycetota bacterium]